MRDYELVELKLCVAKDEGNAANSGGCSQSHEVQFETLMPGLSALCVPVNNMVIRLVALTEDFDLNLLGFATGPQTAVLLVHTDDLHDLRQKGIRIQIETFTEKGALPGWYFHPFPWQDESAISKALQDILPDFAPSYSSGER